MTAEPISTRLFSVLRQLGGALDDAGVPWALVGGLAVSIHVEPRFTRDVDVVVAVPDDSRAELLVRNLVAQGFRLQLSLEQQSLGRLVAVRLLPPDEPDEGIVADLLFASSGIESEICRDADRLEILPALTIPVAKPGHLVAMKLLATAANRPHDTLDLRALIPSLTQEDRERARAAVALIETRGANRSRSLRVDLESWLTDFRPHD